MSKAAAQTFTLDAWKKRAVHQITVTSGSVIGIRIPDLARLIKEDVIPQTMLDAALGAITASDEDKAPTAESVETEREFRDALVLATVVEPVIGAGDLDSIPVEDKDVIVGFALRQRDTDVVGHHIGGLHTDKDFRKFRQLDE